MDLAKLTAAIKVIDISAKTRPAAVRALAQAMHVDGDGSRLDELLAAIEEREATAHTIVAPGFALPHALVEWEGDYRIVLGRSKTGVEYGTPDTDLVHLIVLLVVGQRQSSTHLQALAALAELLGAEEFRQQLITARDAPTIQRLLQERVGLLEPPSRRLPRVPRINTVIALQATQLVEKLGAQAILVAVDDVESVPWKALSDWSGRLLIVTSRTADELPIEREHTHLIDLPHAMLTRTDRANLGLLLSASQGLLTPGSEVVCIAGPGGRRLDSVTVIKPESQFDAMFGERTSRRAARIPPVVILRAVTLALELAEEGRESKPVGTMLVIGDSRQVMRHTKQLVLNPFHGYSRTLRSLLDPSLGETIKEFAQLDGAFVVQADGVVLSAGTYLVPKMSTVKVPSGLGTRHQAAAAITSHTEAMAVVISQSTGTVTAFRHGRIVLKLERATSARP